MIWMVLQRERGQRTMSSMNTQDAITKWQSLSITPCIGVFAGCYFEEDPEWVFYQDQLASIPPSEADRGCIFCLAEYVIRVAVLQLMQGSSLGKMAAAVRNIPTVNNAASASEASRLTHNLIRKVHNKFSADSDEAGTICALTDLKEALASAAKGTIPRAAIFLGSTVDYCKFDGDRIDQARIGAHCKEMLAIIIATCSVPLSSASPSHASQTLTAAAITSLP